MEALYRRACKPDGIFSSEDDPEVAPEEQEDAEEANSSRTPAQDVTQDCMSLLKHLQNESDLIRGEDEQEPFWVFNGFQWFSHVWVILMYCIVLYYLTKFYCLYLFLICFVLFFYNIIYIYSYTMTYLYV